MTDVPFLGSKISLISKCDIRYEGILYCVDPKESTIALSKVKSYGTEARGDPSCYVAPKNEIYDIIIFRASDVKDLRVAAPEPPGLSDPAIISAHHSYSGQSTSTSFNNNTTSTGNSASNNLNNNGSPSASGTSNNHLLAQQTSRQQQQHKPLLPFLPTGSSKDQHQLPTTINYSTAAAGLQRRSRLEPRENSGNANSNSNSNNSNNKRSLDDGNRKATNGNHEHSNRDRRDERRSDRHDDRHDDRREGGRNDKNGDRRDDKKDRNNDDRRGGTGERRGDGTTRISRGGYDGNRNHVNSNPRYNNSNNGYRSRRGPNPNNRDRDRDNNSKGHNGPPHYRRNGPFQGGRRARSGDRTGAPRGPRKVVPLKFEGEYDFDEANKIFLELEGKFKGLKVKDEKDGESSGNGLNSKSPAGHSESGSGYDSDDQDNKDGDSKDGFGGSQPGEYYDKSKSFFDNISCEASERSQGRVNKPDWRKERQLNTDTFGVATSYRRGGYRGRSYGSGGYQRR